MSVQGDGGGALLVQVFGQFFLSLHGAQVLLFGDRQLPGGETGVHLGDLRLDPLDLGIQGENRRRIGLQPKKAVGPVAFELEQLGSQGCGFVCPGDVDPLGTLGLNELPQADRIVHHLPGGFVKRLALDRRQLGLVQRLLEPFEPTHDDVALLAGAVGQTLVGLAELDHLLEFLLEFRVATGLLFAEDFDHLRRRVATALVVLRDVSVDNGIDDVSRFVGIGTGERDVDDLVLLAHHHLQLPAQFRHRVVDVREGLQARHSRQGQRRRQRIGLLDQLRLGIEIVRPAGHEAGGVLFPDLRPGLFDVDSRRAGVTRSGPLQIDDSRHHRRDRRQQHGPPAPPEDLEQTLREPFDHLAHMGHLHRLRHAGFRSVAHHCRSVLRMGLRPPNPTDLCPECKRPC